VDEHRGEDDEREQLEELRLPVLQRRLTELDQVVGDRGMLAVRARLLRVDTPFGEGLGDPREEEESAERDAEPEVLPDALGTLAAHAVDERGDQGARNRDEDDHRQEQDEGPHDGSFDGSTRSPRTPGPRGRNEQGGGR
jgi:hypothetical protein